MNVRLRVDGTNGRVAIYDVTTGGVTDDGPLTSPTSHLDRVRYHSDLDYFEIAAEYTDTITIPQSAPGIGGKTSQVAVNTHGLGSIPYGVLMLNGAQVSPYEPSFLVSGANELRMLSLVVTATQCWIQVYEWVQINLVPAQTITYTIYLLQTAPTNTTTRMVDINPTTGRVILGKGQIDNTSTYLREKASPSFYMTAGRTIDTYLNSWRIFRPNGTTPYTYAPAQYTQTLTPPQAYGVGD